MPGEVFTGWAVVVVSPGGKLLKLQDDVMVKIKHTPPFTSAVVFHTRLTFIFCPSSTSVSPTASTDCMQAPGLISAGEMSRVGNPSLIPGWFCGSRVVSLCASWRRTGMQAWETVWWMVQYFTAVRMCVFLLSLLLEGFLPSSPP